MRIRTSEAPTGMQRDPVPGRGQPVPSYPTAAVLDRFQQRRVQPEFRGVLRLAGSAASTKLSSPRFHAARTVRNTGPCSASSAKSPVRRFGTGRRPRRGVELRRSVRRVFSCRSPVLLLCVLRMSACPWRGPSTPVGSVRGLRGDPNLAHAVGVGGPGPHLEEYGVVLGQYERLGEGECADAVAADLVARVDRQFEEPGGGEDVPPRPPRDPRSQGWVRVDSRLVNSSPSEPAGGTAAPSRGCSAGRSPAADTSPADAAGLGQYRSCWKG